jgi:hypothetical protein
MMTRHSSADTFGAFFRGGGGGGGRRRDMLLCKLFLGLKYFLFLFFESILPTSIKYYFSFGKNSNNPFVSILILCAQWDQNGGNSLIIDNYII